MANWNVKHQASTGAPWIKYARYDWGDVIEGSAEQLRALGLGMGLPYPGEPGGPKRRMTVRGPNGENVSIRAEDTQYAAHVTFVGWPKSPWIKGEPEQPTRFPGVSYRPHCWADEYTGTADALVAAGLVPVGCFPGMPGMRKMRVSIFADGTLPGGGPTANHARAKDPGARSVERAAGARFCVSVYVDSAEHERRRAADHAKENAWTSMVRGLPKPPMLHPLGAPSTWSPTPGPTRNARQIQRQASTPLFDLNPATAAEKEAFENHAMKSLRDLVDFTQTSEYEPWPTRSLSHG
jgi:hypothetical protein